MSPMELRNIRENILKTTKPFLAERMGLSLRAYEEIEAGRSSLRRIHINSLTAVLLQEAASNPGAKMPQYMQLYFKPLQNHWVEEARQEQEAE